MGMVGGFVAVDEDAIKKFRADSGALEEFLNNEDEEPANSMDVDKAWHCIHFMLTGQADGGEEPLAWAIGGGEEIGEDCGYGPARILQPSQVKSVAIALSAIDKTAFASRYNPAAMKAADIYLSDMCVRDGDEALGYIVENYVRMADFYRDAAARGDGAILLLM